jgi:hypothetical protein
LTTRRPPQDNVEERNPAVQPESASGNPFRIHCFLLLPTLVGQYVVSDCLPTAHCETRGRASGAEKMRPPAALVARNKG